MKPCGRAQGRGIFLINRMSQACLDASSMSADAQASKDKSLRTSHVLTAATANKRRLYSSLQVAGLQDTSNDGLLPGPGEMQPTRS